MKLIILSAALCAPAMLLHAQEKAAAPATAPAGTAAPIFDGKSLAGWTTADGKAPGDGWKAEDGVIHLAGKGGDIYSALAYKNFEFTWEWKISEGGNSGVKYRTHKYDGKGWLGLEYQMLDDAKHPDGKIGAHRQTAALYDILPPAADKPLKPVGEWNTSKIVVNGSTIEHWLNGVKTVSVEIGSEAWKAAHAKSKFKGVPDFATHPEGRIMIQDHGDQVWLRNLQVKEIAAAG